MLYSNKRLQNTKRYKEYQELQNKFYKLSLTKEHGQQTYLKNHFIKNQKTNEILDINYSFEKYYKKYTKSIEQKVYTIESIAKDKNLVPIFLTLTLPSMFHPFKSIQYKGKRLYTALNHEFDFKNINEAIKQGYDYLQHIYRIFYKRVKRNVSELMYVKVVETHKTFIPHMHILFFVKKEEIRIIRKHFDNIVSEFNLSQTDLELVGNELQETESKNVNTSINRASKYIMKYITKTLSSGEDYFTARVLDGYKREYRIRMITMSNLDLSLSEFRTIYHGLDIDTKIELLNEAKKEDKSIFYYILKNIYKLKIIKKDTKVFVKTFGSITRSKFMLVTGVTQTLKINGDYHIRNDNFKFFVDYQLVYDKPKYQKIRSYNYEH